MRIMLGVEVFTDIVQMDGRDMSSGGGHSFVLLDAKYLKH